MTINLNHVLFGYTYYIQGLVDIYMKIQGIYEISMFKFIQLLVKDLNCSNIFLLLKIKKINVNDKTIEDIYDIY